ncbi:D-isomer specific 2-hydroxyacid dehydrogenase family protein [Corynebacterium frankenforstense]
MRYVMLPEPWEETEADLAAAGHERVEDLDQADFLLYTGYWDAFPELPDNIRFVQTAFAGLDALVRNGQLDPKVRWANAAGWYADSVAESTLGLLLGVLHEHKLATQAGSFDVVPRIQARSRFLFHEMTVTVLGAGGIGERLIEMLEPFHTHVIAVNTSGREVPGAHETVALADAAGAWGRTDVLVNLLPLTDATRGVVDADLLAALKAGCIVVNTGRGGTVDTDALVAALASGHLGGAGLDVTDPEPLPEDHPLWAMDNVLITPHTANTLPNMHRVTGPRTLENIAAFEAGERMPTEVDVAAQY